MADRAACIRVDFPAPEGPETTIKLPGNPELLSDGPAVRESGPTSVLARLIPASLSIRVTFIRPVPRRARSISSTFAPFNSSEGSISKS